MADSTPAGAGMRVIQSTLEPADLTDAEGDELVRLIDSVSRWMGDTLRESYGVTRDGEKCYRTALIEYTAPDGITRFALQSVDPINAEYSDSIDRATAEAAYEQVVRSLASCAGPGEAWWEHTDVDGVLSSEEEEAATAARWAAAEALPASVVLYDDED